MMEKINRQVPKPKSSLRRNKSPQEQACRVEADKMEEHVSLVLNKAEECEEFINPEIVDSIGCPGLEMDLEKSMQIPTRCAEPPSHSQATEFAQETALQKAKVQDEKPHPDPSTEIYEKADKAIQEFRNRINSIMESAGEPKTLLHIVSTRMRDILTAARDTSVMDTHVIDLLEENWDLLGPGKICSFLLIYCKDVTDAELKYGVAPYAFLWGMITSTRRDHSKILTALQITDNISVDSIVMSKYQTKIKMQLKELNNVLEMMLLNKEDAQEATPKMERITLYDDLEYIREGNRVSLRAIGDQPEESIVEQINTILETLEDPYPLTQIDPRVFVEKFWAISKEDKTQSLEEKVIKLINEL